MEQNAERIERITIPKMDEILGKAFPVLNDGFIRVIDYMGSDSAIVQAARVSYGKGTRKMREDESLIRYLMRHQHTTPFEMCEIKLHIRIPMDAWRQWIRHRTANVNEYSTRYSVAIDATYAMQEDQWRLQTKKNRQGSEGFLHIKQGEKFTKQEEGLHDLARSIYNERIDAGIARELARKDLPLSTYTEAYWKIDLNNLLHFLHLRMETNAQFEIRSYAKLIGEEIMSRWCPVTWQAFQDYVMNGLHFSCFEQKLISAMTKNGREETVKLAEEMGWLPRKDGTLKHHYERAEFEEKCEQMGMQVPWK